MSRRGSYLVLPLMIPPPKPSHVEVRKAEILGEPSPTEAHLARYVLVLVEHLERAFKETGCINEALADRIESLLWPEQFRKECSE